MNNAMSAENQSLQYDNKQLNALIKEYEQTLETLMITFRNQAVSRNARCCPSSWLTNLVMLSARRTRTRAVDYSGVRSQIARA
jgi:hypothetical protein